MFDSEGRELELFADPAVVTHKLIGPLGTDNAHESTMHIRALEQDPGHAEVLAARLRDYLASPPPQPRKRRRREPKRAPLPTFTPAQLALMDLGTLVDRLIERDGFTNALRKAVTQSQATRRSLAALSDHRRRRDPPYSFAPIGVAAVTPGWELSLLGQRIAP